MSEFLDLLDTQGKRTGIVKERQAVHKDGDWHASVHLWIMVGDIVLVQKRSMNKESFPGCYDASVAGHVNAGEEYANAAIRECKEEIGIDLSVDGIFEVGVLPLIISRKDKGFISREINHIFMAKLDAIPETYIDKTEISDIRYMSIYEIENELIKGNPQFCITLDEIKLLLLG